MTEKKMVDAGSVSGMAAIIATMCRAIHARYGDEGLAVMRDELTKTFEGVVSSIARNMGARTGDGAFEDWGKVEEHMCKMMGQEPDVRIGLEGGSVLLRECPMAKQFQRIFPDTCKKVFIGLENGIARAIHPDFVARGNHYLPDGDDCCEIICERRSKV